MVSASSGRSLSEYCLHVRTFIRLAFSYRTHNAIPIPRATTYIVLVAPVVFPTIHVTNENVEQAIRL